LSSVDFLEADQHVQCRVQPRVLPVSSRFRERTALDEAWVDDLPISQLSAQSAIMPLNGIAMRRSSMMLIAQTI